MEKKNLLDRDDVKLFGLALGFAGALYLKLNTQIEDINSNVKAEAMSVVQDVNTQNPTIQNTTTRGAGAAGAVEFTQR